MLDEAHASVTTPGARRQGDWVLRVVASIRFFVVFAVLGTFLSAVVLYVYGTLVVGDIVWDAVARLDVSVHGAQHLQVSFIEVTDLFLLGTVLVIVAFGLYQLFLQPDLPLPTGLRIRDLDELSAKLIEVVGVLLGVTFLSFAVEASVGAGVLEFGVAVAVVIAALSLLLIVSHRLRGGDDPPRAE